MGNSTIDLTDNLHSTDSILSKSTEESEEADKQIILHAIDIGRRVPQPQLNVYSLDTDVLVLLTSFYTQIYHHKRQ
jgi:hypothetical protein